MFKVVGKIMFPESDFYSIFLPALITVAIFIIIFVFWQGKDKSDLGKAISHLKYNTIAVGLLSVLLWFLLPSTSVLSSFGFPETIKEIQSNEQLLRYLQEYNEAIVRTTRVVYWFIFLFVWWFLASVYSVTKALSNRKGEEYFQDVKEKLST